MEEVWKDIMGFEGLYRFSNLYRIKSAPRRGVYKEYLKITTNKQGYPVVRLYYGDGKFQDRKVHRLVLEYFVGLCPPGLVCRHLNDIKDDYRIENLKWGTASENQQDSIRNGTQYTGEHEGTKTHNAILIDENIPEIRKLIKDGVILKVIAKKFNVARQTITDIKFNRTWSHIK